MIKPGSRNLVTHSEKGFWISHWFMSTAIMYVFFSLKLLKDNGYPGIFNISFEYVEGESLLMALRNLALSSGSACTSASLEPSYVLRALGKTEELAHTSIRFGIGYFLATKIFIDGSLRNLRSCSLQR